MKEVRLRDSQKSRADILAAAEVEFADKGIHGARIDRIAENACINKRMIYEYFGGKNELYKAVLANVYSRLSTIEMEELSGMLPPKEAIIKLISLYFNFLKNNPEYVNLILWENLNKGEYIQSIDFKYIKEPTLELMRVIIKRGKEQGVFRKGIDEEQVILSILTFTFSYFSNRYTLSKLLNTNLNDEVNIYKRIDNVTEMFLAYLCD